MASRAAPWGDGRDQGALRVRVRGLPADPPLGHHRVPLPRGGVASQGGRARRPRAVAAHRPRSGPSLAPSPSVGRRRATPFAALGRRLPRVVGVAQLSARELAHPRLLLAQQLEVAGPLLGRRAGPIGRGPKAPLRPPARRPPARGVRRRNPIAYSRRRMRWSNVERHHDDVLAGQRAGSRRPAARDELAPELADRQRLTGPRAPPPDARAAVRVAADPRRWPPSPWRPRSSGSRVALKPLMTQACRPRHTSRPTGLPGRAHRLRRRQHRLARSSSRPTTLYGPPPDDREPGRPAADAGALPLAPVRDGWPLHCRASRCSRSCVAAVRSFRGTHHVEHHLHARPDALDEVRLGDVVERGAEIEVGTTSVSPRSPRWGHGEQQSPASSRPTEPLRTHRLHRLKGTTIAQYRMRGQQGPGPCQRVQSTGDEHERRRSRRSARRSRSPSSTSRPVPILARMRASASPSSGCRSSTAGSSPAATCASR